MNEEHLNMQIRKFLKKVGITSQREIEQAVSRALADGRVAADADMKAEVRLTVPELGLDVTNDGNLYQQ